MPVALNLAFACSVNVRCFESFWNAHDCHKSIRQSRSGVGEMAVAFIQDILVALTPAEQERLATISSDLRFIFCENELPDKVQLAVATRGYKNISSFSVWADSKAGLRTEIARSIIDPGDQALSADQASSAQLYLNLIVASWVVASKRVDEEVRASAEAKLQRIPMMLSKVTLISLRQRFEREHGRVSDLIYPCAAMVEKRLEEIEEGNFTAQSLGDVISVDLAGDESTHITDISSPLKVRRVPKTIALPSTTEELRLRFRTLGITFVLAGYKHATRAWIKTATLENFRLYTEFHRISSRGGGRSFSAGSGRPSGTCIVDNRVELRPCYS